MEGAIIRVLVVDDYAPWRRFVRLTLQAQDKLQIIGELGDGMEAVQKAQELQPHLILLDIGLPTLNGIGAARRIREVSPKSKILFLTQNRSADIAKEALGTGARGYVVKSDGASELLDAIRAVLSGKCFVSASLVGKNLIATQDEEVRHHRHVEPLRKAEPGTTERHEVKFFRDDPAFVDGFARFVGAKLKSGNPVVVLATPSHRTSIVQRLKEEGVDIGRIEKQRYLALDAADSLATFRLAKHLTMAAVRAAKEENLRVGIG